MNGLENQQNNKKMRKDSILYIFQLGWRFSRMGRYSIKESVLLVLVLVAYFVLDNNFASRGSLRNQKQIT